MLLETDSDQNAQFCLVTKLWLFTAHRSHHKEQLIMAKQVEQLTMSKEVVEVGDRAGEGNTHGNLRLVSSMVVIHLQKCNELSGLENVLFNDFIDDELDSEDVSEQRASASLPDSVLFQ